MISYLNSNNKLNETKNSFKITYPRTVNIICGVYPYPEKIHDFILDIKNNLNPKMENYTNVKGGMTDWLHFVNKPNFNHFINYVINKHQLSHSNLFEYFLEKKTIENAWGNEIKKGDYLNFHEHPCVHGILYLTEGCELILPELNIKINPKPGEFYIMDPCIKHGFDKYQEEKNRYSLVFNISDDNHFDYNKKLKKNK